MTEHLLIFMQSWHTSCITGEAYTSFLYSKCKKLHQRFSFLQNFIPYIITEFKENGEILHVLADTNVTFVFPVNGFWIWPCCGLFRKIFVIIINNIVEKKNNFICYESTFIDESIHVNIVFLGVKK